MKCEECKELIVDYIHGELSSKDRSIVKEHLDSCSKCSREFELYTQIQKVAQSEELPEVSNEILARLSKAANEDIQKNKKSVWEKWSFSPILVPAITTAIVLSVWFYYGYDVTNIAPRDSSSEYAVLKTPVEAVENESSSTDRVILKDNLQMDTAVVEEGQSDSALRGDYSSPEQNPSARRHEPLPPPPAPDPKEFEYQVSLEQVRRTQDSEQMAMGKAEAPPKQTATGNLEPKEPEVDMLSKKGISDLSAQSNIEDKCDVSIKTNEALLNSTPPASLTAQQQSYKELAECYELKGDYDQAIANYINLQQVAPEESSFANSRIQDIQNRVKSDQLRKEKMTEPLPSH